MSDRLVLGTRGSELALTQCGQVQRALGGEGAGVVLEIVRTEGDRRRDVDLASGALDTGAFTKALETALLERRVDVAVHSLKDLPTTPARGLALAAVPLREDPRDVVVARDGLTLGELPAGSVVGTGAPRRAAQLHALGLGLEVVPVRGNVDTRVGKVRRGDLDAVVLARAGLARLGRLEEVTETLDPLQMLPAPGQGALAVETRAADAALAREVGAALDHGATRAAVTAERRLLADLEAGCSAPVGALAELVEGDDGEELWMRAVVVAASGAPTVRRSASGPPDDPEGLGRRLAEEMLDDGAALVMREPVP